MTEDIFNAWKAEQAQKTTVSSMCILFLFYKHITIENEKCDFTFYFCFDKKKSQTP